MTSIITLMMLTARPANTPRWSLPRGNPLVPSSWRATLLVKAGQLSDASRRLIEQGGLADRFIFIPDPTDEELRSLYRRAAVLLFPSRHEGFGWPPLEAMATGCPVVVSNTGSLPEVCGNAALYASPTEPREIAEAIASVLDDEAERRRLIELGHHRARQFSWEESAARFIELGARPG